MSCNARLNHAFQCRRARKSKDWQGPTTTRADDRHTRKTSRRSANPLPLEQKALPSLSPCCYCGLSGQSAWDQWQRLRPWESYCKRFPAILQGHNSLRLLVAATDPANAASATATASAAALTNVASPVCRTGWSLMAVCADLSESRAKGVTWRVAGAAADACAAEATAAGKQTACYVPP